MQVPASAIPNVIQHIIDTLKQIQTEPIGEDAIIVDDYLIYRDDDFVWKAERKDCPDCLKKFKIVAQNRNYFFMLEDFFKCLINDIVILSDASVTCEFVDDEEVGEDGGDDN